MKQILLSAHIVILVLLLSACGGGSKTSSVQEEGDTLKMRYATNLSVVKFPDYTMVSIRNPWDTLKTLHTYLLTDKTQPVPGNLPEGTVVRVPLERADGCRNGEIVDCGNGMNPDIEKIIDLRPDAIMLSPFENSGGYGRVGKLGVPVIECADYMETSPLGRAEWLRFYGLLVGQEQRGDSLFAQIENEYLAVKALAAHAASRPTVLSDLKYGSAWYIAGGQSTTGRLYADAGADYIFAELPNSGSVPMAFETVFDKGEHADFWLIKYNQPHDKTYRIIRFMRVSRHSANVGFMDATPIGYLFMRSHLFIRRYC